MNNLIRYFDLSPVTKLRDPNHAKKLYYLMQYIALILGITVQPFMVNYQNNKVWNFSGLGGWIIFAIIVGIIIFPSVYKRAFDPEKPFFVQLCAVFASGIGWESLLHTGIKAANFG